MFTKINSTSVKKNLAYNYAEYLCDTVDDIKELPTNKVQGINSKTCSIGSKALVLDTKDIYILSSNNTWVYYNNASSCCSDFKPVFI